MKNNVLILLLTTICSTSFGQNADFNIHYMLRGQIYAKSSIKDSTALGGFGDSYNVPKRITDTLKFREKGLFLKIDTTKIISVADQYKGYYFYIVNKSDSILQLDASDSRLYVIAEAYVKKKWQPIEYLPSSWCGNSYHHVYLNQNEYWEFKIPKFDGKIQTKIRYRLRIGKHKYIYSNEVAAKINKKQLTEKQGYQPNGIMDPYND